MERGWGREDILKIIIRTAFSNKKIARTIKERGKKKKKSQDYIKVMAETDRCFKICNISYYPIFFHFTAIIYAVLLIFPCPYFSWY